MRREGTGEDVATLEPREERGDLPLDRIGQARARGHEDGRRVRPMLCLCHEIGGNDGGICPVVGQDHAL
jgi:hypothetical protein